MELPLHPNSSDIAVATIGMRRERNAETVCSVKMATTGMTHAVEELFMAAGPKMVTRVIPR